MIATRLKPPKSSKNVPKKWSNMILHFTKITFFWNINKKHIKNLKKHDSSAKFDFVFVQEFSRREGGIKQSNFNFH